MYARPLERGQQSCGACYRHRGKLTRAKMLLEKSLTVREAAARIKVCNEWDPIVCENTPPKDKDSRKKVMFLSR